MAKLAIRHVWLLSGAERHQYHQYHQLPAPKSIYLFNPIPLLLFMVFMSKLYGPVLLNWFVCECMNVESWGDTSTDLRHNKMLKRKCSAWSV